MLTSIITDIYYVTITASQVMTLQYYRNVGMYKKWIQRLTSVVPRSFLLVSCRKLTGSSAWTRTDFFSRLCTYYSIVDWVKEFWPLNVSHKGHNQSCMPAMDDIFPAIITALSLLLHWPWGRLKITIQDRHKTNALYSVTRLQTFWNSFSSSALTDSITESDWRHMSLNTWNMRGDWSASTRIHVAIRSTSSSVIGYQHTHQQHHYFHFSRLT